MNRDEIQILKHKEHLDARRVKIITFMSFLLGFSQALLTYVLSTYFVRAAGTDNIGIFYFISYIIILFSLLNLHKFVRFLGKSQVFYFFLILKIFAIAALIFLPPSPGGILFLMFYIIFGVLGWVSIDIILESFSIDHRSGRIRGLYLTIANAGFMIGPFISSRILQSEGFSKIFLLSLIFNIIILLISFFGVGAVNHGQPPKTTVKELLKKVSKRKNVLKAYYIAFVLDFFYALTIIYVPLHLLSLGLSWHDLGFVFTIMLIPFVLIQYPAGMLADRKLGEKELLIFSLLVISLSTASIYFVETPSIALWSFILFITRIGAALIEVLRDSYFYKRIDGHDVDLIDFFRTSRPVAYILASIFSTLLLFVFPLKSVFILISVVAAIGLYPAFTLADNKAEEEIKAIS